MDIKTFDRKPFSVQAVQVTRENMKEVAEWCKGTIETKETPTRNGTKREKFVKVPTKKPMNEKQTQAFASDWVLLLDKQFKVYTHRAFIHTFQEAVTYTEADSIEQRDHPGEPVEEIYEAPRQPAGNVFENAQDEIQADEKVEKDAVLMAQAIAQVDADLPEGVTAGRRQIAIGEAYKKLQAEVTI